MAKAFRFYRAGKPDVMRWEDVTLGKPGRNEALITHKAIGLNYIDTYFRSGLYPPPALPSGLGMEGAGIVEAVGRSVKHIKKGDRVAYALGPLGAYSEQRIMPADVLVKLPRAISFEQGAAMMLKGMTAQYLVRRTYPIKKGETILCMPPLAASASLRANGQSVSAPRSSGPSAARPRPRSPNATVQVT